MKQLSPPTARASLSPASRPRYLLELQFTTPTTKVLRLADQPHTSLLGVEWLPLVASWGDLDEALNTLDVGGRPATATLSFFNRKPIAGKSRMSDLIRTRFNTDGAFEWAFAKATVKQLLSPEHVLGDEIVLGVFFLEEPEDIDENLLTVRMSDWSLALEKKLRITRITRDDFTTAPKSVVGRTIPRAFGSLTNVPAIPVVDGAVTTLNGSLTAAATTVTLADATDFAASDTIQVDIEHITLGTKSGNQFTGCTRGANSTTAAAHDGRADVLQVKSSYTFVICENDTNFKTKVISNVKVNGRAARTSPSTNVDDDTIVSGKRFARITFTPSNPRLFHTQPVGGAQVVSVPSLTVTGDGETYVADSEAVTPTAAAEVPMKPRRTITFTVSTSTAFDHTNFWTLSRSGAGGPGVQIAEGQGTAGNTAGNVWTGSHTQEGLNDGAETITFTALLGSAKVITCGIDSYSVEYIGDAPGGESTSARVIGEVTCDVEGIADDAAGSISGTASQLLENPTDIAKVILTALFPGVTVADLGASWVTTRARHAAGAYKWAFLLDFTELSKLRRKLGEQARSALFLEGQQWEWKYLEDTPTPQLILDYDRDISRDTPARVQRTARTEIRNQLFGYSQRDYSKSGSLEDIYQRVKEHEDLDPDGDGVDDDALPYDLELALVQDATTADNLGAFWLAQWKRQRFVLDLVAWWNVLTVDKVDYLAITNHPILAQHGGTNLVFRVVEKRYLGDGKIGLRLVEANT